MNHQKCMCGKPVGHGRHTEQGFSASFWYFCECGFKSRTRKELDKHLKQVKDELAQQKLILGR
jgi:hypothetical protein